MTTNRAKNARAREVRQAAQGHIATRRTDEDPKRKICDRCGKTFETYNSNMLFLELGEGREMTIGCDPLRVYVATTDGGVERHVCPGCVEVDDVADIELGTEEEMEVYQIVDDFIARRDLARTERSANVGGLS